MGRIDVDPGTFEAASKIFGHDVANALFEDYCVLQGALGDTGGMAGSDPAGVRWGSSYDAALVQISGVTQDVINGVYTLAGLLVTTGFNHGLANSASEPGGTHDVVDHEDYGGDSVGLGGFQTASGSAGSDEPTGWQLVVSAVGYVWPNGHQDKLRAAAAAWSKGAQAVTTAGYLVPSAVGAIGGQRSPEVPDAVAACNAMGNHLAELSAAYNSMSTACTDYAGYIDAAHSDAIGELRSLLEWTAGIEIAGGLFSIVTAGLAEVPTQAVEAGRIAATAARIASIIEHLIEMAGQVAETISNVASKAIEISEKLKVLLGARLSEITARVVSKLPGAAKDAGELATRALEADADILATTPELSITRAQIEAKFKHAADFGITEPRGAAGFDAYTKAVDALVTDPATTRVVGTYRGQPAVLNYDPVTKLVVVESPDGAFVSGWKMTDAQLQNVVERGSLGGG